MPQGLQVWNESGVLVLDLNTRTGTIIGTHGINGQPVNSSGSITVPGLAEGTPFAFVRTTWSTSPIVTVSGTTISWVFTRAAPAAAYFQIVYGYF